MSYINGAEVLPAHLLKEIQKHIDGGLIYIPKDTQKVGWGQLSGARKKIDQRNREIIHYYNKGYSINDLTRKFFLSPETIKKIIYSKNKVKAGG